MGNVERRTIRECPLCHAAKTHIDGCAHTGSVRHDQAEWVEYVPASQLRGAVEMLYNAHDFISRVTTWEGTDESEKAEALREIAHVLPPRGQ